MIRTITRIIRDPLWQFVGVIIAIAALIISLLPFRGEKKALQVVILSSSSLVKIDESVANEISALFQDKPVESLDLITIKLENVGEQSIRPEDYELPIKIVFPKPAIVINAKVIETFPPNLPFDLTTNENEVIFPKSLINKGDKLIIEFKVINIPAKTIGASPFSISERIFEISDIPIVNVINEQKKIEPVWQISGAILSLLAVLISLLFFTKNLRTTSLRIRLVENIQISELSEYQIEGYNLTYAGKDVDNLSLLVVEIQNTGNTAIQGEDYLHPIEFKFPKISQVLDAKVTKTNPSEITTKTSVQEGNSIIFTADLLNPKDTVVLNFIVSNAHRENDNIPFFVSTRIIGLRNVNVQ